MVRVRVRVRARVRVRVRGRVRLPPSTSRWISQPGSTQSIAGRRLISNLVEEKCSIEPVKVKDMTSMSTWPSTYPGECSSLVVPSGLSAG